MNSFLEILFDAIIMKLHPLKFSMFIVFRGEMTIGHWSLLTSRIAVSVFFMWTGLLVKTLTNSQCSFQALSVSVVPISKQYCMEVVERSLVALHGLSALALSVCILYHFIREKCSEFKAYANTIDLYLTVSFH